MVALCALAYRLPPGGVGGVAEAPRSVPALAVGRAYLQLTKPRIVILLLITTVPAMILAARAVPSPWLILATLLGGSMAAGAANAINCYLDRDIDSKMSRTRQRPLPRHAVEPGAAFRFGVVLALVSTAWLALTTNVLAAALSALAILFYVFVYTAWMKRTTPQNIVIGGAAGAIPALVGWAAVTGRVGVPALLLFGVVFLWTPPHFWALSLRYVDDYREAGVPMLPVVRGVEETTKRIVRYTAALLPMSLVLAPVAHLGPVYAVAAAGLWIWLATRALGLRRDPSLARAMRLFHTSNAYLALLFAAVAVDVLATGGSLT
ncbi:MAG: heme o synthase [Actinomycetota bacterium]|nr:heme o synthase [Actinomycetota bacterium]